MAYENGPFIQTACFCEQVIEDKTGVLSLIRIVDTVTHTVGGPTPPTEMPQFVYNSKLVLTFKSGNARGRSDLKITPELPTGETKDPITLTLHFEGEEKGQNFILDLNFPFDYEGLYWFNVYIDDQKVTSIPIRVKYNRIVTRSTPAQT
jgi:hypothetical protein